MMFLTYYESAEDVMISKERALAELKLHNMTNDDEISEFLNDCGDKQEYNAQSVLVWLGY